MFEDEVKGRQNIIDNIEKVMAIYKGRPFEQKFFEMILAHYDGPFGKNKSDESSLFCSELIAATLQHLGLLKFPPEGLPSNEYTPRDFSTESKGEFMDFVGVSLSEEIPIKIKKKL